jgi:hypothetical protein
MRRLLPTLLLVAVLAAACGQDPAGPEAGGDSGMPATSLPPDTPVSSPPAADQPPPTGVRATTVVPHPGPGPLTAVAPQRLRVGVTGGQAHADVYWWSGVEPCYALRPVRVTRTGDTIRLRLFEGSDARDAACIELAMFKTTRVDLGVLPPGTYTVRAGQARAMLRVA